MAEPRDVNVSVVVDRSDGSGSSSESVSVGFNVKVVIKNEQPKEKTLKSITCEESQSATVESGSKSTVTKVKEHEPAQLPGVLRAEKFEEIDEIPVHRLVQRVRCPKMCSSYAKPWFCSRCYEQVYFAFNGICYCPCGKYRIETTLFRCNVETHLFDSGIRAVPDNEHHSVQPDQKNKEQLMIWCLLLFCEMLLVLVKRNIALLTELKEDSTLRKAFLLTSSAVRPILTPTLLDVEPVKIRFLPAPFNEWLCEVFVSEIFADAREVLPARDKLLERLETEQNELVRYKQLMDEVLVDKSLNLDADKVVTDVRKYLLDSRYADEVREFLAVVEEAA
ncbi:hypothetical protein QR680_008461 [Steinernema hermaphroditum]|uniref:Uncharacterized protein n=1 Tax=Steinernema hermaphroditum TaxID=289476 RepID=A0AA39M7W7_9BILA|nr:hypothetical protein QR680_008461 [Steinernema hermaphroditum]